MLSHDENRLSPPKESSDDTRISTSAPQSRCNSWRSRHHRANLRREKRISAAVRANSLSLPDCSTRTTSSSSSSVSPTPSRLQRKLSSSSSRGDACALCTVRSFRTTSKGIVESSSFSKSLSSNSLLSTGSLARRSTSTSRSASMERQRASSLDSCSDESEGGKPGVVVTPSYYRTLVLGAPGVGKSSMVRQFTRSDSLSDDDEQSAPSIVSVQLDAEESTMEFIDGSEWSDLECHRVDAYVVMYAVSEPESFTAAQSLLTYLRQDLGTDRTIYLVANKTDLMRQRLVSSTEAKEIAIKNDSLFIETSIALNVNLDELLIGVLCKIKHQLTPVHEDDDDFENSRHRLKPSAIARMDRRQLSPSRTLTAIGNFLKQACRRDHRRRTLTPLVQIA